ncbi:hypothetical protein ACJX0J_022283, partial [Zea mays]
MGAFILALILMYNIDGMHQERNRRSILKGKGDAISTRFIGIFNSFSLEDVTFYHPLTYKGTSIIILYFDNLLPLWNCSCNLMHNLFMLKFISVHDELQPLIVSMLIGPFAIYRLLKNLKRSHVPLGAMDTFQYLLHIHRGDQLKSVVAGLYKFI